VIAENMIGAPKISAGMTTRARRQRCESHGPAGLTLVSRTVPEPLSLVSAERAQVAGPTEDQPIYAVRTNGADHFGIARPAPLHHAGAHDLRGHGPAAGRGRDLRRDVYAVARRVRELGIRAALGSPRAEMVGLVLWQGMRLAAMGMAGGVIAALALTRLMAGMLYVVRLADPLNLAAVALLLGAIALLACYIPARRATAVDPVLALRNE